MIEIRKIFLLSGFIFSMRVFSCTCIGETTTKQEIRTSDVVAIGQVVMAEYIKINSSWDVDTILKLKYTIRLEEVYKGKIKTKDIYILTGSGNGDCGFVFNIREKYIIYANWRNQFFKNEIKVKKYLYTDSCKRTRIYDLDEVNEIKKYKRVKRFKHRA